MGSDQRTPLRGARLCLVGYLLLINLIELVCCNYAVTLALSSWPMSAEPDQSVSDWCEIKRYRSTEIIRYPRPSIPFPCRRSSPPSLTSNHPAQHNQRFATCKPELLCSLNLLPRGLAVRAHAHADDRSSLTASVANHLRATAIDQDGSEFSH